MFEKKNNPHTVIVRKVIIKILEMGWGSQSEVLTAPGFQGPELQLLSPRVHMGCFYVLEFYPNAQKHASRCIG